MKTFLFKKSINFSNLIEQLYLQFKRLDLSIVKHFLNHALTLAMPLCKSTKLPVWNERKVRQISIKTKLKTRLRKKHFHTTMLFTTNSGRDRFFPHIPKTSSSWDMIYLLPRYIFQNYTIIMDFFCHPITDSIQVYNQTVSRRCNA